MDGHIIVVTGWRVAGKTTFCKQAALHARNAGWRVAGILTPAVFENGEKIGIEVEDLVSGEKQLLAVRSTEGPSIMSIGQWHFDPEVFRWGNEVLQKAAPCDLLIIDEIGPLEFERKQGWTAGLDALDNGNFMLALVVIRPEYEKAFRARWPEAGVVTINTPGEVKQQVEEFAKRYFESAR